MSDTTAKDFADQLLSDSIVNSISTQFEIELRIVNAISHLLPADSTATDYLQTHIFPTLVPALEAYLVLCEKRKAEDRDSPEPMDWIAAYLMRHNPNAAR